jgi:hypothetical protein
MVRNHSTDAKDQGKPAVAGCVVLNSLALQPELSIKGIFRSKPACTFPVLPYNLSPILPVLLCIWLIGVIRQKPDKEVRDRRLNESQPALAG